MQRDEEDLPSWFGKVITEEIKREIPASLKEKFPESFGY